MKLDEEFRDVIGYEDVYSVSNLGRVRRDAGGGSAVVGRILRPAVYSHGYPQIVLSLKGVRTNRMVHRLVVEAFLGPCPQGLEVNHLDGCKTNNQVGNLEYVTRSKNHLHAFQLGLRETPKGEDRRDAKLTDKKVRWIRKQYATGSALQRELAKKLGVSRQLVGDVLSGRIWKHVA